ncbi:class I SAM-dependent methyltransferase [Nitrosomonas sp.]|uniref:class I SAM-dependent methyltransferase n=1 Tax=Nitrosomonas sp. TaxID=42353 RepID=UPI0025E0D4D4|nr:class I SAM-dependent methyltransferase [Nitrosomonas sp.]MBY0484913.1 class I SAM-dependent methyltransferase [Nitrosomonas sp.]
MQPDRIGTETSSACYMCSKEGEILYRNLVDRVFGAPGEWTFKKCTDADCGLVWLDPRPKINEIGKAYQNYYTHGHTNHAQQTRLAKTVRSFLHALSISLLGLRSKRRRYKCMYLNKITPGRLLEVGCGNGKRLARMRDLGWDVTGQEIDPMASEYVREEKGIPVHLGPLETMDTPGEFDVVILSHVIEHVHDPVALLRMCHRLLKKNGLLVLLTPNVLSYGHRRFGADWRGLESPRHIHLFTCKTLVRLAQKSGFSNPNSWTTPIGAYGIGQSSLPSAKTTKSGCQCITTRDVLRGFWFQFAAHLVFQFDKNSGEECVLMATK